MGGRWGQVALVCGLLAVLVLAGVLLTSCGTSYGTTATTLAGGTPTTGATTPTSTGGAGAQVSLENIQIVPATVTIAKGASVTWTNNDSVNHRLVGDNGEFDSGNMAPGATFSFTFSTAGTVNYHCSIHPSMTGAIKVQ